MGYEDRIEALFERHQSVQSKGFTGEAYKPGLEAMLRFCEGMGNPHESFRSVHVAGTNGKGSVCSMLASALAATGLRVGLYTSPHLLDFRERIKLICPSLHDSSMISQSEVLEFLDMTEEKSDGLSFFEMTTGMAFWWFRRQQVDVAVIETGLGGRLDSTNILTPDLSIITSIGLDHCAILGPTRTAIAGEKAGIFKPGRPALVWGHDSETDQVFEEAAARMSAELHYADSMGVVPDAGLLSEMDLKGPCQDLNLRTVEAAMQLLQLPVSREAILNAARNTALHGRWERLLDKPEVICDIGHNPPALKENFARLQAAAHPQGLPERPLIIVYGIMADKDLAGIAPLMPTDAHYILCAPDTVRAMPAALLSDNLLQLRPELQVQRVDYVQDAVREALFLAQNDPRTLIYIGGSTFVVSEALDLFS